MRFIGAISGRFGGARQKFAGERAMCRPVKFRANGFQFARVIPEKVIWYEYSTWLRHIKNLDSTIQPTNRSSQSLAL